MLQPERAARLTAFADRQEDALSLPEVLDVVLAKSWNAPRGAEPRLRSLQRVSERVVLDSLMILGAHSETTPEARAVAFETLERLGEDISERHDEDRAPKRISGRRSATSRALFGIPTPSRPNRPCPRGDGARAHGIRSHRGHLWVEDGFPDAEEIRRSHEK